MSESSESSVHTTLTSDASMPERPRPPRPPSQHPRRDAMLGAIVVLLVVAGIIAGLSNLISGKAGGDSYSSATQTAQAAPSASHTAVSKPTTAPKPTTPPVTYSTIKTFSGVGQGPEVVTPEFLALDGYRVTWSITSAPWSAPRNFAIHTHYGSASDSFTIPGPFISSRHPNQADHGSFILKPGGNLGSLTFLKVYAAGVSYRIEVQQPV